MYCPKCGTQNPENASVCMSCSQPLSGSGEAFAGPAKTSALAIWSFVLSILNLFTCMITWLPALICGIVSVVKISKSNGRLKGTGFAVAGITLSVVYLVFILPMTLAVLMPALGKARTVAQRIMCGTNLSLINNAMKDYAADNNDMYPPAENWCDVLIKDYNTAPAQFRCPSGTAEKGQSSYAININIAGKNASDVPSDTVLLFETNPGVNPAGGPEILITENHQGDGCNILFADGQVKFVKKSEFSTLRWKPD